MNANPLDEIRKTERSVAALIAEAKHEAAAALHEARRQAEQLVEDARARGHATAVGRYEEALARAQDESDRIEEGADQRLADLRRRVEAHMAAAVDLVLDTVLPSSENSPPVSEESPHARTDA